MAFLLKHPRSSVQILLERIFFSTSVRFKKNCILDGSKIHGDNVLFLYDDIFGNFTYRNLAVAK